MGHSDVKTTMIASDVVRAVLALLLVFAGSLYQIYAILFALSAVSSFFIPAQSVALRIIVPREGLMAANALMSQAMYVMRIISPSISGALVASVGFVFVLFVRTDSLMQIRYAIVILVSGLVVYMVRASRRGEWPFGQRRATVIEGVAND